MQARPRQPSTSGDSSPSSQTGPDLAAATPQRAAGKTLSSRAASYARLPASASCSEMPSAAPPPPTPRWYSNRAWCVAALFTVLILCSLNVAKLMGTAHSGVEVVTAASQGSTLQVRTLRLRCASSLLGLEG